MTVKVIQYPYCLLRERLSGERVARMGVVRKVSKVIVTMFRSVLFLSSYAPLGVILAVIVWPKSRGLSIALGVIVLVSLGLLWLLFRELRSSAPKQIDIEQIQRRDADIVNYIVTYAIPFLTIPFEDAEVTVGLVMFFVVVWLLQVKLDLLYINPILAIFNYHIYEITTAETVQILVSKRRIGAAGTIRARKVGDSFLLESEP